ncbi:type IV toxin-antitoxin system AbiEi family antitoxin [Pedobacter gandavensis]|uniref:type IV toxin-antitoxin system AbiEi family antitoxin n=1 Tax=Pedobacter gandavensis TaxID=2679963 RepID=UPI00292E461E|nr:type IV toxin-antitoxin system AbiEi family antitoxin [Pedobacter gandavensis]
MSTNNPTKINYLLNSQPSGTVFTSSWLVKNGYSLDLQQRYKRSQWLTSIGTGAVKRTGEEVGIEGGLYALQNQLNLSVHIGGVSALARLGRAQYLELDSKQLYFFGSLTESLPKWFKDYQWGVKINYHTTGFLPPDLGMTEIKTGNMTLKYSGPVRAILECLYLAPVEVSLMECYELLEGMSNLRPNTVQELLESCGSVKVKRAFLFMAEKTGHAWVKHIVKDKIDLGSGKRSLVTNGVYVPKYGITVPKELISNAAGL